MCDHLIISDNKYLFKINGKNIRQNIGHLKTQVKMELKLKKL